MTLVEVNPTSLSSLADVEARCSAIEVWAEQCDSVPELRDAGNRLAAIDEYLSRTNKEGRGRVSMAMRRLEIRIGVLLGPAAQGGDRKSNQFVRERTDLSADQRQEFRQMAANPQVVERVIEESTDAAPASRRKILLAIQATSKSAPSSEKVADRSEWHHNKRRIDGNRIVREMAIMLAGLADNVGLIDVDAITQEVKNEWVDSMKQSLRTLSRLTKEMMRE